MRNSSIIIFILFSLWTNGQNQASLYSKIKVTPGSILIRLAPSSMEMFERLKKEGLRMERWVKGNGEPAKLSRTILCLRPYGENDTSLWMPLFRSNRNKYALVHQLLYNNRSKEKDAVMAGKQEKLLYDLLMLSCDHDAEAARACGLLISDSVDARSTTYEYRISMNGKTPVHPITFTVDPNIESKRQVTGQLSVLCSSGKKLLYWDAEAEKEIFSGYVLERSENAMDFFPLNTSPLILMKSKHEPNKRNIYFHDTTALNDREYVYRIRGIDHFGDTALPSNNLPVRFYKGFFGSIETDSLKVIDNKRVKLKWHLTNEVDKQALDRVIVWRSEKEGGPYKGIATLRNEDHFIDEPGQTSYYKVYAVGKACDTLKSYPLMAVINDTIPPSVPQGLKAVCDRSGYIFLSWDKVKDRLSGYKVYRKNTLTSEPVQCNDKFISDTCYRIKVPLNTKTRVLYFSVAATDQNYNSSELSEFLAVPVFDTLPPSKPLLMAASVAEKGIMLRFVVLSEEDLNKAEIIRTDLRDHSVRIIHINIKDSTIIDTTAVASAAYSYWVKVTDQSGNVSQSNYLTVLNENGFRQGIENISVKADRKKKTITLTWQSHSDEIEKYIIYRAKKGKPLTIIQTLPGHLHDYIDDECSMGNIYVYRIKAVYFSGTESILSNELEVEY